MTDQPDQLPDETAPAPDPAPDDVPADDALELEEERDVDPAAESRVGRKPSQDPDVPASS